MIESSDKDQKRSNKVVTRTMASFFFEEDQFVEMEAEGQRDEFMSEPEDLESFAIIGGVRKFR